MNYILQQFVSKRKYMSILLCLVAILAPNMSSQMLIFQITNKDLISTLIKSS